MCSLSSILSTLRGYRRWRAPSLTRRPILAWVWICSLCRWSCSLLYNKFLKRHFGTQHSTQLETAGVAKILDGDFGNSTRHNHFIVELADETVWTGRSCGRIERLRDSRKATNASSSCGLSELPNAGILSPPLTMRMIILSRVSLSPT